MRIARLYDVGITNLLIVRLAARVTYVIDKNGIIRKAFESVRPQGHAAEVLTCILPSSKEHGGTREDSEPPDKREP